jgi:hypothetical protein
LDLSAQRRLGDVKVFGGAAEVEPLGDRDEAPKLDQIEIADAVNVSSRFRGAGG